MIVAEGYLFELEARGYLQFGASVPEVVIEHPELVRQLHEEFVHAGSDVVLALTVSTNFHIICLSGPCWAKLLRYTIYF